MFVCTANLCRSPMAEHLLKRRLVRAGFDWTVNSVGTDATDGRDMHPSTRTTLTGLGANVSSRWRSTRFSAARASSARLILTATHAHLAYVLDAVPSAARRSFVLGQFAYLLAHNYDRAESPEDLIRLAVTARAEVQPRPRDRDDLADPIGRADDAFRYCAGRIDDDLAHVMARLAPGSAFG
jgi:protein-tyrosine phosphatase